MGGVSSSDSCSYLIRIQVREAGHLYGGKREGARESLRELPYLRWAAQTRGKALLETGGTGAQPGL